MTNEFVPAEASKIICGPLINYRGTAPSSSGSLIWSGSILIVTAPSPIPPLLNYKPANSNQSPIAVEADLLYSDEYASFYRYSIQIELIERETSWQYWFVGAVYTHTGEIDYSYDADEGPVDKRAEKRNAKLPIPDSDSAIAGSERLPSNSSFSFHVPAKHQSMRILFYSCNGFSVGTDLPEWSGPGGVLWKDVARFHSRKPFHVMLGGGDQVYQDGVRAYGPLKHWTNIAGVDERREYPFLPSLRSSCDRFYLATYLKWYSRPEFGGSTATVPAINLWDDHDIIDGFGSYDNLTMKSPVFEGIGEVAWKYYLLFQQHLAPAEQHSTFPATFADQALQQRDLVDPIYVLGSTGPYLKQKSKNIVTQLGHEIAFVGLDARTERTRSVINTPETYNLVFNRLAAHLKTFSATKHVLVMLGVPIAYPRLAWLERIFRLRATKAAGRLSAKFAFSCGGFFNPFDGSADLNDDLDDHYTAPLHKKERTELVRRLQEFSHEHNVRVTILSGDVHLAAVGRFYGRHPKSKNPAKSHRTVSNRGNIDDNRMIVNIVSSAITNKPPPKAVAKLLALRNRTHHFSKDTDEILVDVFDRDPASSSSKEQGEAKGVVKRRRNKVTMPSRNFAILELVPQQNLGVVEHIPFNPKHAIHGGEVNAGSSHFAAGGMIDNVATTAGQFSALGVSLRVEIDPHDLDGWTDGYGLAIPALD